MKLKYKSVRRSTNPHVELRRGYVKKCLYFDVQRGTVQKVSIHRIFPDFVARDIDLIVDIYEKRKWIEKWRK